MQLKKFIETTCNKPISECSNQELYLALLSYTKEQIKEKETPCNDKKKLYYISAEFLIGKLLSNNLINLGIYDEVALLLKGNGKSLAEIEEKRTRYGCNSNKRILWSSSNNRCF